MDNVNAAIDLISIHAPVKGATGGSNINVTGFKISIHAPVKGATLLNSMRNRFYMISIHAPVKGATLSPGVVSRKGGDFNPRTREGCDCKDNPDHPPHPFMREDDRGLVGIQSAGR